MEQDGTLRPGQPVVELTSGNTGTGLAIVCGVKGNPFIAVMSEGNSMERARMMAALGAEVVLVPQVHILPKLTVSCSHSFSQSNSVPCAQRPGGVEGQVSGEDLALVEQVRALHFRLSHSFLHTSLKSPCGAEGAGACGGARGVQSRPVQPQRQLPGALPPHRAGNYPAGTNIRL